MPTEINLPKIESIEIPRKILSIHFKSLNGELPIRGGWGYTKADACIIDKNDPTVDPNIPFDWVGLEYIFAEKRIYEEMIIVQPEGKKYAGIRWNTQIQRLIKEDGRVFDQLVYEITAFPEQDWKDLKAEWEGSQGYGSANFNVKAHEKKSQEKMVELIREFWFDITSFYGQNDTWEDDTFAVEHINPPDDMI